MLLKIIGGSLDVTIGDLRECEFVENVSEDALRLRFAALVQDGHQFMQVNYTSIG